VAGFITTIGKLTWPIVGSNGVTGGLAKRRAVETVGENLMVLHQSVIGIATLVGADKLHLNTKWARLCSLQCQRVKQMPTTTHSKAQ